MPFPKCQTIALTPVEVFHQANFVFAQDFPPFLLFQVDKPVSRTKQKKTPTTTTGKMVKKSKEKQIASSQSAKKKPSSCAPKPKPDGAVTKKSKEISNRLAESKQ